MRNFKIEELNAISTINTTAFGERFDTNGGPIKSSQERRAEHNRNPGVNCQEYLQ
jgi:hypothetical protein